MKGFTKRDAINQDLKQLAEDFVNVLNNEERGSKKQHFEEFQRNIQTLFAYDTFEKFLKTNPSDPISEINQRTELYQKIKNSPCYAPFQTGKQGVLYPTFSFFQNELDEKVNPDQLLRKCLEKQPALFIKAIENENFILPISGSDPRFQLLAIDYFMHHLSRQRLPLMLKKNYEAEDVRYAQIAKLYAIASFGLALILLLSGSMMGALYAAKFENRKDWEAARDSSDEASWEEMKESYEATRAVLNNHVLNCEMTCMIVASFLLLTIIGRCYAKMKQSIAKENSHFVEQKTELANTIGESLNKNITWLASGYPCLISFYQPSSETSVGHYGNGSSLHANT